MTQAAVAESSPAEVSRKSATVSRLPTADVPRPEPVAAPVATPVKAKGEPKKPSLVRRILLTTVVTAALLGGGYYGYNWYMVGRFQVSTDDAYVKADMSQLGAKVAGYVAAISVAENTRVKAGDIVMRLEDGDYRLAVEAARGRIATQQAQIEEIAREGSAQQAEISAAEARLASADANLNNAQLTLERKSKLVSSHITSKQSVDDAEQTRATAAAAVTEAKAGIEAAKAQSNVIDAKRAQAERALDELKTALAKAERDLAFTEIKAPFDGIVANRAVEPGQYVQAGTRLMALVPVDSAYIEANFKETQLSDIKPGQKALITVDAFGSKPFEGTVESVSPASGAEFSLLPPENATGNFTKITQRVPVRVSTPPELLGKLRTGLSVVVSIDSRDEGTKAN